MRYPKFLDKEGTIGFIAPSFGCTIPPYNFRFDKAISVFEGMGYKCVEGPNARASAGIGKSNTPEACGAEVNDFFINKKTDVIISCGGGELMCEDLPFIDFEAIKKAESTWYMGFSDNTNLTFLLPTLCDTAAIYGPCVSDFGMSPWHKAIEDAFSLLKGERKSFKNYDGWESESPDKEANPYAPYNINEPYQQVIAGKAEKAADFEGRLIGGCMDCLVNLCGTPFDKVKQFNERYKEDGIIWFIEACDLYPMGIRRALWQMKENGWFEYVKGFIVGRPMHYNEEFDGFTCKDAVTGILGEYDVPIILDVDLGHMHPMIPLISGSYAKVSAVENSFNIEMFLS